MIVNKPKTQSKDSLVKGYVQVYQNVPESDLAISDLVELAIHRSKVHSEIVGLKSDDSSLESNTTIDTKLQKFDIPIGQVRVNLPCPKDRVQPELSFPIADQEFLDVHSFFAYMLISLKDVETQTEFVSNEKQIFHRRFIDSITRYEKMKMVSDFEFPEFLLKMSPVPFDLQQCYNQKTETYSIPFEYVFSYIDVSRCKLSNGFVELLPNELSGFFANLYSSYLNRVFASYRKAKLNESDIFRIALSLYEERKGTHGMKRTDYLKLSYQDIPSVVRSFPPCMFNMYQALKSKHKLMHDGRLQLGLFLKGIGLSIDDSLRFWKDEFSKSVGSDKFDKQYAYNIRHYYGKEGSSKNLNPHACFKIINTPAPSADQTHGCPFRTMQHDELRSLLKNMVPSVPLSQIEHMIGKAKDDPGKACRILFDEMHKNEEYDETGISHPCRYFAESENRYKKLEK